MASSDPDDKLGGQRLPASASGPLAAGQVLGSQLGLSPDVSHTSVCEPHPTSAGKFHTKTFQTKRIGKSLSKRSFVFPSGGVFYKMPERGIYLRASPKACLSKIEVDVLGAGVSKQITLLFSTPSPSTAFFLPSEIKF